MSRSPDRADGQSPPRRPTSPTPGSSPSSSAPTVTPAHIIEINGRLQDSGLSHDQRQQLEKRLLSMQRHPGFLVSALKICNAKDDQVPKEIQQLTAIQFRRVVVSTWLHTHEKQEKKKEKKRVALTEEEAAEEEDERAVNPFWDVVIGDGEKRAIREGIFSVLVAASPDIFRQLIDAFKNIAKCDYPAKWPGIFGEIGRMLKSTRDLHILALSLESLLMLFKTYEFCHIDSGKRGPLYSLVDGCFPTVLSIMKAMCEVNSAEAREVQRWCVRLFYSGLNVSLPPHFISRFENFAEWMEAFFKILALPQPPGEPQEKDKRDDWSPWKLRKWIFHSFNRLISRYAVMRKGSPEEWRPFAQRLFNVFTPRMLQATFTYLELFKKGQHIPDRLMQCLISYIDSAYRFKNLYELLKPRFGVVLMHVILPLLSFGPKDLKEWRDDPTEYLRSGNDILQEYFDPRKTAVSFLSDLMRQKSSDLLKPFTDYLVSIFSEFAKAENQTLPLAGKFTGALFCLGIIHDPLIKDARFQDGLESLLRGFVVPALTCKFPFIRAKALWTFATFSDVPFKDPQILSVALSKVLTLMTDTELPVKVEATMALRTFLEFDICRQTIRGHLPVLIDRIFKLFKVLDHDELVQCLEVIIIRFEKEIHPFAKVIINQFATEFHRLMRVVEDEDSEMTAIAVDEILRAVIALLAAIRKHPSLYPQIEGAALSIVKRVLNQDCIDLVEHGIKILSLLTYFPDKITENVWSFYRPLIQLYRTWGSDFFAELVPVWDNYITNDRDTFLSPGSPYLDDTMRVIEYSFKGKGNFTGRDYDCAEAAKLAEVLMQTCRDKIDKYIPGMLNMIFARLKSCKNKGVYQYLMTALSNVFFYNPMLAIAVLEKKKMTKQVLQLWISKEPALKKLYDLKLIVLGLSAIFRLPLDKAPPDVQQALPHILRTCLKVINRMNEILARREDKRSEKKALKAKGTSGNLTTAEVNSDSEEEVDGDQRTGLEDLSLADIRELQAETQARLDGEYDSSEDSDSTSDDDYEPADSDDDMVKEPAIENLVDGTDELVYFIDSLREFKQRLPAIYKRLHDSSLSPPQQESLRQLIQEATSRNPSS